MPVERCTNSISEYCATRVSASTPAGTDSRRCSSELTHRSSKIDRMLLTRTWSESSSSPASIAMSFCVRSSASCS